MKNSGDEENNIRKCHDYDLKPNSRIRRCDRTSHLGGILATLSLNNHETDVGHKSIKPCSSPNVEKPKSTKNLFQTPTVEAPRRDSSVPTHLDIPCCCCEENAVVMSPLGTPSPLAKSKISNGTDYSSIVSYSSTTPVSKQSATSSENETNRSSPSSNSSSSETLSASEYSNELIGVGLKSSTSDEDYSEGHEHDDDIESEAEDSELLDDSCIVSEDYVPYGRVTEMSHDEHTNSETSSSHLESEEKYLPTEDESFQVDEDSSVNDSGVSEVVEAVVHEENTFSESLSHFETEDNRTQDTSLHVDANSSVHDSVNQWMEAVVDEQSGKGDSKIQFVDRQEEEEEEEDNRTHNETFQIDMNSSVDDSGSEVVEAIVLEDDMHDSSQVTVVVDVKTSKDNGKNGGKHRDGKKDHVDATCSFHSDDQERDSSKRSFHDLMDAQKSTLPNFIHDHDNVFMTKVDEKGSKMPIFNVSANSSGSNKTIIRKGKWTLGSRIGQGSFGVVHVGMNQITGNLLAVKSLNITSSAGSSSGSHDDLLNDLRREIDLMKSFNHPNIVRYLGCELDETKHILHIFQEWVPGGSVTALLAKFGPFPTAVIRSYLYQVLLGLEYLHANHILHRDIKGGNILVNNEGVVKLADFGASKTFHVTHNGELLDAEDAMSQMTMRGTPYFMAPEVFEEKYGCKADIWSFGCVAYQMLTSNPPWKGLGFQSPMKLFLYICRHTGPPPMKQPTKGDRDAMTNHQNKLDDEASSGPFLSDSLSNLLEQCFQRDPSNRPSAQTLLQHSFFTEVDPNESFVGDDESIPGGSVIEQKKDASSPPPSALSPFSPLRLADWKRSRTASHNDDHVLPEEKEKKPEGTVHEDWPSWAKE